MSELSPKARQLVEASRKALRPTGVDRERIEDALRAKLGRRALPDPAPRTAGPWPVLGGAAIVVCLLGIGAFQALRSEPSPRQPSEIKRPVVAKPVATVEPAAQATTEPPAAVEPPAAPRVDPPPKLRATRSVHPDRLSIELDLLSRATAALRGGDARGALEVLDQHQRRFPHGALTEERRIARAQALCNLGRVREGRKELEHQPPGTPAHARARQSCGLER